jgi:hypothetical protein
MQALQRHDEEYANESSEMIMEQQSWTAPWRKSVVVVLGSALLVAAMVVFNASSRGLVGITNNDLVNFEETTCSKSHENCMESRCCADGSAKCFMKNQYWASCIETCDKNYQDEYDKSMGITAGWECKELNPGQVLHCARAHDDCSDNPNCCDGGSGEKMVCFRKAPGWSNCNPTCTRIGDNSYDKDGGAWSCEHHELVCEPALAENATGAQQLECCQNLHCDGKKCTKQVCTFYEELAKNESNIDKNESNTEFTER